MIIAETSFIFYRLPTSMGVRSVIIMRRAFQEISPSVEGEKERRRGKEDKRRGQKTTGPPGPAGLPPGFLEAACFREPPQMTKKASAK